MRHTKQAIIDEMRSTGFVPLFTPSNAGEALSIVKTCYDAGIRTFEFTNRKENSLEVFSSLNASREKMPGLMLGAGTIMDNATARKFLDGGADFIISPVVKPEMSKVCAEYGVHWIPGAATLTEIVTAKDHGAEVIKVFPGSVLGPGFISAIMPVVSGLNLMVTGGVEATEQNLSAWFRAGVLCVGLGSSLFSKEVLQQKNWDKLGEDIRKAKELVQSVKSKRPI